MGNGYDLKFRIHGGETLTLSISGIRIPGSRERTKTMTLCARLAQNEELLSTNQKTRKVGVEIEEITKTGLVPRLPIRAVSTKLCAIELFCA